MAISYTPPYQTLMKAMGDHVNDLTQEQIYKGMMKIFKQLAKKMAEDMINSVDLSLTEHFTPNNHSVAITYERMTKHEIKQSPHPER
jgi:hypothetical protein